MGDGVEIVATDLMTIIFVTHTAAMIKAKMVSFESDQNAMKKYVVVCRLLIPVPIG